MYMLCKKEWLIVVSLWFLMPALEAYAEDRAVCGRDFYNVSIEKVMDAYVKEYEVTGFVITRQYISKEQAGLQVVYTVPGFHYQMELDHKFSFAGETSDIQLKASYAGRIHDCPTKHIFKEPKDDKNVETYIYIEQYEKADRIVEEQITKQFPLTK